jgi:hypothetical protein
MRVVIDGQLYVPAKELAYMQSVVGELLDAGNAAQEASGNMLEHIDDKASRAFDRALKRGGVAMLRTAKTLSPE